MGSSFDQTLRQPGARERHATFYAGGRIHNPERAFHSNGWVKVDCCSGNRLFADIAESGIISDNFGRFIIPGGVRFVRCFSAVSFLHHSNSSCIRVCYGFSFVYRNAG